MARTPSDAITTGTNSDFRAVAFGFAQRRSWVFWAWWYPAVLALAGAVHAGLATGVIRTMLAAGVLGIGALVLLTPLGRSLEAAPVLGMLVAVLLGTAAGLARTGWLMQNSAGLYSRWLNRRDIP